MRDGENLPNDMSKRVNMFLKEGSKTERKKTINQVSFWILISVTLKSRSLEIKYFSKVPYRRLLLPTGQSTTVHLHKFSSEPTACQPMGLLSFKI